MLAILSYIMSVHSSPLSSNRAISLKNTLSDTGSWVVMKWSLTLKDKKEWCEEASNWAASVPLQIAVNDQSPSSYCVARRKQTGKESNHLQLVHGHSCHGCKQNVYIWNSWHSGWELQLSKIYSIWRKYKESLLNILLHPWLIPKQPGLLLLISHMFSWTEIWCFSRPAHQTDFIGMFTEPLLDSLGLAVHRAVRRSWGVSFSMEHFCAVKTHNLTPGTEDRSFSICIL